MNRPIFVCVKLSFSISKEKACIFKYHAGNQILGLATFRVPLCNTKPQPYQSTITQKRKNKAGHITNKQNYKIKRTTKSNGIRKAVDGKSSLAEKRVNNKPTDDQMKLEGLMCEGWENAI